MENEEGKAYRKKEALENKSLKRKAKIGKGKASREEDEYPPPSSSVKMLLGSDLTKDPLADALWKRLKMGRMKRKNMCDAHKNDDLSVVDRLSRISAADLRRERYKFVKGRKICISRDFERSTRMAKFCYNSSWVAVHGLGSICTVTVRKAEDTIAPDFTEAVFSEVECLLHNDNFYNPEILHKLCGDKVEKPFGVVSLVMGNDKSWEEAIDPVFNFLKQEMQNSALSFTDYKTLQTTIGAFQRICPHTVTAKDMWVTIMKVSSGNVDFLDIGTITEQLDIVNGLIIPPSSLKPLFVKRGPMYRPPL